MAKSMSIQMKGFICVEGVDSNCDEFWQQIRATNWQRITLIDTENDLRDTAFDDYNELADTSQLFRVLEQRNCDTIVKNFLGFQSSAATTAANTTTTAAAAPVAKE
ncbi:unnamed protein product [Oppiella nova]|uniref:Uncharacterized protein n=1 Tax=Oppiella nova TaxID=334625 RepID=A0A7R9MLA6_9ACAR|nr:unnamed protein product [Oppiella nova]CAG2179463.1 unnamed protein product [Oppiella nova]